MSAPLPRAPVLLTVPEAVRELKMRDGEAEALLRQHGLIGEVTVIVTRGGESVSRTVERVAAHKLADLFDPERRQERTPATVVRLPRRTV